MAKERNARCWNKLTGCMWIHRSPPCFASTNTTPAGIPFPDHFDQAVAMMDDKRMCEDSSGVKRALWARRADDK